MNDDRLRVSVDPTYTAALGLATYCFTMLEWNAVYLGEKLKLGFIGTVGTKTAGQIANEVANMATKINDATKRARFQAAAAEFIGLTKRRNDRLHSNPATVDGEQRLVRNGAAWQPAAIETLAEQFTACSGELNELYHHVL